MNQKGKAEINMEKLYRQILQMRQLVAAAKPRSHRRIELELLLRDLVTKHLRAESRHDRRRVA